MDVSIQGGHPILKLCSYIPPLAHVVRDVMYTAGLVRPVTPGSDHLFKMDSGNTYRAWTCRFL